MQMRKLAEAPKVVNAAATPPPTSLQSAPSTDAGRTVHTGIGPYAPMRRGWNSLAKAVSNLSSGGESEAGNSRRFST